LAVIGGKSRCDISKILVTSGGGIGIIEPKDCATTLGNDDRDEFCADTNKP
jgi:hypothetical protein